VATTSTTLAQNSPPQPQAFSFNGITFDYTQFEVPENLTLEFEVIGGAEDIPASAGQTAQTVVQTFGAVMKPIKFDASFIGPAALSKALALEVMLQQQSPGTFQFGSRTIQAQLMTLTERYRTINDIGYSVEIQPLIQTTSAASLQQSATLTLQNQLGAINDTTLVDIPPTDIPASSTAAINLAQSTTVSGASLTQLSTLLSTLTGAAADLQTLAATKSGSTAASDVSEYLAATGLANSMLSASSTLAQFTGGSGQTVSTSGANVYQLAARYTGSIDNAGAIMAANAIEDPFNIGTSTILIPGILNAL